MWLSVHYKNLCVVPVLLHRRIHHPAATDMLAINNHVHGLYAITETQP
ncbi:unnamed protein product [Schistosoma mattheei]|uniref:Uncharacterized protein n=1 Tax=Schistosoma mattheei TaxID=31246 RepID=A0A183NLH5_9TREM|nr:unnamed protein product [Schistosoma mattheei]